MTTQEYIEIDFTVKAENLTESQCMARCKKACDAGDDDMEEYWHERAIEHQMNILDEFNQLSLDEKRAFQAWFSGGKINVIKWGEQPFVVFGKSECEQVDFEAVWRGKFVKHGWVEIKELRRFKALGIEGHPLSVEYEIRCTEKGWKVREAYLQRR